MYPEWAEWLGWTLAFSSILMIPGVAIVQMCKASGSFKKVGNQNTTITIPNNYQWPITGGLNSSIEPDLYLE